MSEGMKLCMDCKHAYHEVWRRSNVAADWECRHPEVTLSSVSMVTGEKLRRYCDTIRRLGQCGPEATLWEAKE